MPLPIVTGDGSAAPHILFVVHARDHKRDKRNYCDAGNPAQWLAKGCVTTLHQTARPGIPITGITPWQSSLGSRRAWSSPAAKTRWPRRWFRKKIDVQCNNAQTRVHGWSSLNQQRLPTFNLTAAMELGLAIPPDADSYGADEVMFRDVVCCGAVVGIPPQTNMRSRTGELSH